MASEASLNEPTLLWAPDEKWTPSAYEKIIPLGETYVYHALFSRIGKKEREARILLLTRKHLYQFNPYNNNLLSKTDLREIYRVEKSLSGGVTITTLHSSFLQRKTSIENWGKGDSSLTSVQRCDYTTESQTATFDFTLVANRLRIDRWQCMFEEELKIVPKPEIFKGAFLVTKLNRHRKLQARWFVLSDAKMYNVDTGKKGYDPRNAKWAISFEHLLSISILTMDTDVYGLSIQLDPTGPVKEVKNVTVILLNSNEERNLLYVHS